MIRVKKIHLHELLPLSISISMIFILFRNFINTKLPAGDDGAVLITLLEYYRLRGEYGGLNVILMHTIPYQLNVITLWKIITYFIALITNGIITIKLFVTTSFIFSILISYIYARKLGLSRETVTIFISCYLFNPLLLYELIVGHYLPFFAFVMLLPTCIIYIYVLLNYHHQKIFINPKMYLLLVFVTFIVGFSLTTYPPSFALYVPLFGLIVLAFLIYHHSKMLIKRLIILIFITIVLISSLVIYYPISVMELQFPPYIQVKRWPYIEKVVKAFSYSCVLEAILCRLPMKHYMYNYKSPMDIILTFNRDYENLWLLVFLLCFSISMMIYLRKNYIKESERYLHERMLSALFRLITQKGELHKLYNSLINIIREDPTAVNTIVHFIVETVGRRRKVHRSDLPPIAIKHLNKLEREGLIRKIGRASSKDL